MINKSLAEVWDICVNRVYDRQQYIKSLDNLLKKEEVRKIIDPACGTGYPSLDLANLGYDITFSDGSKEMLKQFHKNSKYKIRAKKIDWRDLSRYYKEEFDFVLIRSNSLTYATSWDKKDINLKELKKAIIDSVKNFYQILRKDGILYIDLYEENEKPYTRDLGSVVINNDVENWKWVVEHNWQNRIRSWKIIREDISNGERREYSSLSYLIKHEELIDILKKIGFNEVDKTDLEGSFYTIYLARK